MLRSKVLACLALLFAFSLPLFAAPAPVPRFTISASNVSMPTSGSVAIPFTLTSTNGFAGLVAVDCAAPTVAANVRAPYCNQGGPIMAYTLAADGTTPGSMIIVAVKPNLTPLASRSRPGKSGQEGGWAIAGVAMLGLGLRKKIPRRLAGMSIAVGTVLTLAGIGICGCGGPPTLTPGAYVFTLTATSVSNGTGSSAVTASTTATVTVPAGVPTKSTD